MSPRGANQVADFCGTLKHEMSRSDLIAKLRRRIERSREVLQQSRECRKRAEERTAESKRLFTLAELARQRRNGRNANSKANSRADKANNTTGRNTQYRNLNRHPEAMERGSSSDPERRGGGYRHGQAPE